MIDTSFKGDRQRAPTHHPNQHAMQDHDLVQRLEADPKDCEAQLDAGIDASMDASDPPSTTPPHVGNDPLPSSGFDEVAEKEIRERQQP